MRISSINRAMKAEYGISADTVLGQVQARLQQAVDDDIAVELIGIVDMIRAFLKRGSIWKLVRLFATLAIEIARRQEEKQSA